MTPERRAAERARLQAAFDAIPTDHSFQWRRTFTEGDVSAFCGVTGDFNPYHLDEQFASASRFGTRIIPGLLTASMVTHIGGLLGFLASEMHFEFLGPVYVGDTITCTVRMAERDPERLRLGGLATFTNQRDEEVLRGRFSGIPGQVRLR
jgi:3-hydroxybutyryl-CoA dehydratase